MEYFVKTTSGEKGPYTLDQIRDAAREGLLSRASEVRDAESESWRPIAEVLSSKRGRKARPAESQRDERSDADTAEDTDDADVRQVPADRGSFFLGLLAGLVGGVVVILFVLRRGKPDTRLGVYLGAAVQILVLALTQCQ